jgi:iron complex transport system ATP-binding protein
MAIAQQPKLLLLDEPTAHLDISHQSEIIDMVKGLNRQHGLTVIASVHDLNMAALYFDRLVLLKNGHVHADGTPNEVLTAANILEVFSATVKIAPHPAADVPHVIVMPRN